MKTRTLIGAALLLSTTGIGVALAAAEADHLTSSHHERHGGATSSAIEGRPIRFAEESHERRRDGEHRGRRHHDDDDDDDEDEGEDEDDEGGRRGAIPQAGPADPNAPMPDNGLFNGKARPKVEVQ